MEWRTCQNIGERGTAFSHLNSTQIFLGKLFHPIPTRGKNSNHNVLLYNLEKMVLVIQWNIGRSVIQIASAFHQISYRVGVGVRFFSTVKISDEKVSNKPPICTADELHYVSLNTCDWRLALWRYVPPPQVKFLLLICNYNKLRVVVRFKFYSRNVVINRLQGEIIRLFSCLA